MRITISIDKEYNDKNIALVTDAIERMDIINMERISIRRSEHNCIYVDAEYSDNFGYWLEDRLDYSDIADMYLVLIRLVTGDDIRRIRDDAMKILKGGEINHYISAKIEISEDEKE